ncbi:MAG: hypothetical protein R2730_00150 [Chitinophagales bacterium]
MSSDNFNSYSSDDIKLTDIIRSFRSYSVFIFKKFYYVILGMIVMGVLGYFYATTSPTKYQANASFNVVDSKGLGGGLAGLLGNFGLASFGGSTSNEVMAGLMMSRHIVKNSFLAEVPYKSDTAKLIDIYLDVYGIREDWEEDPAMKGFQFKANNVFELTRKEDSLLNIFWKPFVEDYLEVEFELLEGLVKANVKTYSYEFSRGMLANMLEYSTRYFTDKQSEGKVEAYDLAEYKVDSISALLEGKRAQYAVEQNKSSFLVDATGSVALTKLSGEISNLTFRLGTARETLDAAKSALMQEAPIINIVDHPDFATDIKRKKWKLWAIIGAVVGVALSILILMLVKAANDGFEEERILQEQNS